MNWVVPAGRRIEVEVKKYKREREVEATEGVPKMGKGSKRQG